MRSPDTSDYVVQLQRSQLSRDFEAAERSLENRQNWKLITMNFGMSLDV